MAATEVLFPNTDYVSLREACHICPGRPSLSTLLRWTSVGVAGIKLRSIRVGGKRLVARDDLVKFIDRVTKKAEVVK